MMEGKRFGIGLAVGVLLALAIVTVSGGLGSTPFASLAPRAAVSSASTTIAASTTTIATPTVTMSTTSALPATVTSTASMTTTTNGGSEGSLNSTMTYPSNSVTSSSTTVTVTASSISSITSHSTPGSQASAANSAANATSATNGSPYYLAPPSGTNKPTRLASIAQQPIASNAEILAPILVAFLLGAFLYRVTVRERERSSGD